MRLNFNLDEGYLQTQPGNGYAAPIVNITVRRGDTPVLQIGACLTGVAANLDLGDGATPDVALVVNESSGDSRYDGPSVLTRSGFTKVTIDGQIYYQAAVSLAAVVQIDTDLGVGAGADVDFVTYSAQVSLVYNGGRQTSRKFDFVVENNLRNAGAPIDGGGPAFSGEVLDGGAP